MGQILALVILVIPIAVPIICLSNVIKTFKANRSLACAIWIVVTVAMFALFLAWAGAILYSAHQYGL